MNGVGSELSGYEIQPGQLGPGGVPAWESPAKMTPKREKKAPTDIDSGRPA
jgi:hypothetical protein